MLIFFRHYQTFRTWKYVSNQLGCPICILGGNCIPVCIYVRDRMHSFHEETIFSLQNTWWPRPSHNGTNWLPSTGSYTIKRQLQKRDHQVSVLWRRHFYPHGLAEPEGGYWITHRLSVRGPLVRPCVHLPTAKTESARYLQFWSHPHDMAIHPHISFFILKKKSKLPIF